MGTAGLGAMVLRVMADPCNKMQLLLCHAWNFLFTGFKIHTSSSEECLSEGETLPESNLIGSFQVANISSWICPMVSMEVEFQLQMMWKSRRKEQHTGFLWSR